MDDRAPGSGELHLAVTDSDAGGAGPGIVFTHGWLDDRHVWDGVIEALGSGRRCVAWDLRAHGRSEIAPPGNYTRDHVLGDLRRIVALAGPPAVLVGHSLGGYLSLAYALRHPDQVRGLVLVAAGPGFRNPDSREQWNASVEESAARVGVASGSQEISKHVDSWVLDSLGEITAPAVVVVGERDKRFQASAAVFEKYLDVRATVIVPDAGHSVHRKHPDAVATAIEQLLDELPR